MVSQEQWLSARHEAGHAVAALHYDCPLMHVTIEREAYKLGTTRLGLQKREDAIVLFCGPLAERDWDTFRPGANVQIKTYGSDEENLRHLQQQFGDLQELFNEALLFIMNPEIQRQIDRVAHALLQRTTLTADEVRAESEFRGPLRPGRG